VDQQNFQTAFELPYFGPDQALNLLCQVFPIESFGAARPQRCQRLTLAATPAVPEEFRGATTGSRRGAEAGEPLPQAGHLGVADRPEDAGVPEFLNAAPDATFTLARDHWATEQHILAAGVPWTFARMSLYLDFLPTMEDYFAAKRHLFDGRSAAHVVCVDDVVKNRLVTRRGLRQRLGFWYGLLDDHFLKTGKSVSQRLLHSTLERYRGTGASMAGAAKVHADDAALHVRYLKLSAVRFDVAAHAFEGALGNRLTVVLMHQAVQLKHEAHDRVARNLVAQLGFFREAGDHAPQRLAMQRVQPIDGRQDAVLAQFQGPDQERPQARIVKSTIVRIPQSVYWPKPGIDHLRPTQATPIPNLFLAGGYTTQEFYDSMEGAVASGRLAATARTLGADSIAVTKLDDTAVQDGGDAFSAGSALNVLAHLRLPPLLCSTGRDVLADLRLPSAADLAVAALEEAAGLRPSSPVPFSQSWEKGDRVPMVRG